VLDPEENFILFSEPFEPDAILDRIVEEKSNPAAHAERSQAGSEAIRQNFSSDAISDRYVDLYMRLLSQRVV
jgi:glycosyltransferase involved in cell wall biosynthesis